LAKLTRAKIKELNQLRAEIQFPGTPENGYGDAGLFKFLPYVYTKDSHDKLNPVKPLLGPGDDYAIIVFLYLLAFSDVAFPKSRQIRMSWINCAYALWHAMSGPYRHVVYQTKKDTDAQAQTTLGSNDPGGGRMDFILQHLPDWLKDQHIASGRGNAVGALNFTPHAYSPSGDTIPWQGSKINAIPQGGKQIRQYTPSLLISDESAFQEEYAAAMTAAEQALKGGGQSISVSTVEHGSAFNDMVLDIKGGGDVAHTGIPEIIQRGMDYLGVKWQPGMRAWTTTGDVRVLEVKYNADPKKDPEREGAAWLKEAVKGKAYRGDFDSIAWQTEMEINYGAGGGRKVFEFIKPGSPIYIDAFKPGQIKRRMTFYAGYDYGTSNASAFVVWGLDKDGKAYAVWELYEPARNLKTHVAKMMMCPYWSDIQYIMCDQSMGYRQNRDSKSGGLRTLTDDFADEGVIMSPGRRGVDLAVAERFKATYWLNPDEPKAFITKACPMLWWEVCNLRMREHLTAAVAARHNQPEEIKQKDNHAWDATAALFDFLPNAFTPPEKRPPGPGTFGHAAKELQMIADKSRRKTGGIQIGGYRD
jgi:hypothetical protein